MEELLVVDAQGHVHSACLHWDGFPRRLWELLSAAGYLQPPVYDGHEFVEDGVRRCSVTMVIPQHPLNGWEPIVTQMVGHYLLDTWELTAMRAMTTFCSSHPLEVVLTAFGLFPAPDPADPLWLDRMAHVDVVATLDPVGALRTTAMCLDGLYRLHTYQSYAVAQLVDHAQALHLAVQLRDGQLQEASTELESRATLIAQLHGQVHELQDTVSDRDATINFLEDQFHDLQLEMDEAQGQLHAIQHAQDALHAPPDEMQVDEEDEPQEIEGVSEMDSEDQAPQPAPVEVHTPAASEASVNM
mgnify:FL=1